jgi:hypothetical protein
METKGSKEKPVINKKAKKIFKFILGTIGVILIGAIGSGVWEIILAPALKYIGNFITSTISSVSTVYSDSLYSKAANITSSDDSLNAGFLILTIIFFSLFIYGLNQNKENRIISSLLKFFVEPWQVLSGPIVCGVFIVVTIFLMATDSTIFKIKNYSTKQMEIIRPYIGETQYLILRSDYLQIKNKKDFDSFLKKLYSHADNIKKFKK